MPTIISKPHICRSELYKTVVPAGTKLSDIISGLDFAHLHIVYNGTPIKSEIECNFIVLNSEEDNLLIVNVPTGKSGAILGAIATIAAGFAGAWAGGWLATSVMGLAAKSVGAYLVTGLTAGGFTVATRLLFNALVPPADLGDRNDKIGKIGIRPSITGTRNTYALWRPIPRLYGTYRYFPPLAARPFTELAGNDQYMRMLFCLGYGPLRIGGKTATKNTKLTHNSGISKGTIRIGETDIHNFEDVEYEITGINNISLFTRNIYEETVGVALKLRGTPTSEDYWNSDNVSATRATDDDTIQISLDIVFPSGLYEMNKRGTTRTAIVEFKVEIRDYNSNSLVKSDTFKISGATKRTKRVNKRYNVSKGKYNVTLTRVRTWIEDKEAIVTDCNWSVLRSIKPTSEKLFNDNGKNILFMALKIKASDQLNGVIEQLNIEASSILPVYDGSSWTEKATSNPAWIYYHQLTGEHIKNPVAKSDILIEDIKKWADFCDSRGLSFNYVFDSETTQFQCLQNIATTGLAAFAYKDGYYTVVYDRNTSSDVPVQVITPRNARNFSAKRIFQDLSHGLRVRYVDKNADYEEDEILVYREGYNFSNAKRYETLDTLGVTDQNLAWKLGKYHYAQAYMRPEVYTVEMDFENLVATRGDVVLLSYDIIKVGLHWGRIRNITTSTIEVDEQCEIQEGKTYGVKIRKQNGNIVSAKVQNSTTGWTNNLELDIDPSEHGVTAGDLFIFGEYQEEYIRCKVLSIEYNHDLSARLLLIDEAPNISNFTSSIYTRQISNFLDYSKIKPPKLNIQANSSSDIFILSQDGTYVPCVLVTWELSKSTDVPLTEVEVRYRSKSDSDANWITQKGDYTSGSLRIIDIQEGSNIEIQGRVKSLYGQYSDWSDSIMHVVGFGYFVPSDIENFYAVQQGDFVVLKWKSVDDVTFSGYEIREGISWDTGKIIFDNLSKNTAYWKPPYDGTYRFWIKAKNRFGNYSRNPTNVQISVTGITEKLNIIETQNEFTKSSPVDGTKDNFVYVDTSSTPALCNPCALVDTDVSSWTDTTTEITNYKGDQILTSSYISLPIDLGEPIPSTVRIKTEYTATCRKATDQTYPDRTDQTYPSDTDTSVTAEVKVNEFAYISDDNNDYTRIDSNIFDDSFRYVKFGLDLEVDSPYTLFELTNLEIIVDVPDKELKINHVDISTSGTSVTFADYNIKFYKKYVVSAVSYGNYYPVISDKTLDSFTIYLYDTADNLVSGYVDIFVKGY